MTLNKNSKFSRGTVLSITAIVLLSGLSGCYYHEQYSVRSDKLTPSAGDAINTNKATHTISPLPKHVQNDRILIDSNRGLKTIENYQQNKTNNSNGHNKSNIQTNVN